MKKKYVNWTILLLMVVLASISVYGVATIVGPASGTTSIAGSTVFNVTTSALINVTYCNLTGNSTLTSDTINWQVNLTNATQHTNRTNGTLDTTQLEDATDWSIGGICRNGTTTETITMRTFTIDNTVPNAPTGLTTSATTKSGFSVTSTVTGANTTACIAIFQSATDTRRDTTLTHSGNTCSGTISLPGSGDWQWYVEASDGTNKTNSSLTNIKVEESGRGGPGGGATSASRAAAEAAATQAQAEADSKKKKSTAIFVVIIIAAVVYAMGGFTTRKR